MTEFQVGDRVSVEGVVTRIGSDAYVRFTVASGGDAEEWFPTNRLTLVERPKRKLRVGSVWERGGARWAVGTNADGDQHLVRLSDGAWMALHSADFDEWREVPVEELEAEAQG